MKPILLVALAVFWAVVAVAQTNSIVDENKVWSNLQEICESDQILYRTFYNRFEGDIEIDGKNYKEVLIAEDEYAQNWFFTGEMVREENNRVYLIDALGEEGLLYDFNVGLGDTVTITNPLTIDGLFLTVVAIDSIETIDGYRKRWKLIADEFSPPEYWIEGIGSESGVLNSGTGVFLGLCGTYFLLCATEGNNQVYQNPQYENCYFNLLDNDEITFGKANDFLFTYKAAEKKLLIQFPDFKQKKLMVTNIFGKVVYKNDVISERTSIDLSAYQSGVYVVSVITNGTINSKKIMVY